MTESNHRHPRTFIHSSRGRRGEGDSFAQRMQRGGEIPQLPAKATLAGGGRIPQLQPRQLQQKRQAASRQAESCSDCRQATPAGNSFAQRMQRMAGNSSNSSFQPRQQPLGIHSHSECRMPQPAAGRQSRAAESRSDCRQAESRSGVTQ